MLCSPVNIFVLLLSDSFLREGAGLNVSRCSGNLIHHGRTRRVGLRHLTMSRHFSDRGGIISDTWVDTLAGIHRPKMKKQVKSILNKRQKLVCCRACLNDLHQNVSIGKTCQ